MSDGGSVLGGLLLLVLLMLGYFIPTLLAIGQRHQQAVAIGALNLFLGWTVIGWVAALVWSLTTPAPTAPPPVVVTQAAPAAIPTATLRPCPYCAEPIQPAAKVCRFCNRDVQPLA